jgi:hypothetical protein
MSTAKLKTANESSKEYWDRWEGARLARVWDWGSDTFHLQGPTFHDWEPSLCGVRPTNNYAGGDVWPHMVPYEEGEEVSGGHICKSCLRVLHSAAYLERERATREQVERERAQRVQATQGE